MAVDLDVIPMAPLQVSWKQLKEELCSEIAVSPVRELIGDAPRLHRRGTHQPLSDDESLEISGYYYFEMRETCTLGLQIEPNIGGDEDLEYFHDHTFDLPPILATPLQKSWEDAGYLVSVSSLAGRHVNEIPAMLFVAWCISRLTQGFVVVKEDGLFSHSKGVYSSVAIRKWCDSPVGWQGQ